MRIIFINIAVFVIIRLIAVAFTLFGVNYDIISWLGVPSDVALLAVKPWTLITYMFVQYDILHILFNMLWLYWFGVMFKLAFNNKQLLALYIYGGIGGALLYILAYSLFPIGYSYLIGASASVLAIVVATAVRMPNYQIRLLFFGDIKLKWIALVTIFLDVIGITSANAGGHISHLGGAVVGAIFAICYAKGVDITSPFNNFIDKIVTFVKPKRNIFVGRKPKGNSAGKSSSSSKSKSDNEAEMNIILEKIKKTGYAGLTEAEKAKLFDVSKKL